MSDANITPYGAFELKATYQRNLFLSNLAVLSLAAVLLIALWVFSRSDPPVVVKPVERSERTTMELTQFNPESLVRDRPARPGAASAASEGVRGIPVPVTDSALADPDEVVLSRADRAALLDWNGTLGEGEPGPIVVRTDIPEELPGINDFVKVETPPELVKKVPPEYPRFAEQSGINGTVWIKALVSNTGTVLEAVVYKSSGFEILDEAALKVALEYRYKPAVQNSRPVAVWVSYRVDFRLDE